MSRSEPLLAAPPAAWGWRNGAAPAGKAIHILQVLPSRFSKRFWVQKRLFVRKALRNEAWWCRGGAGADAHPLLIGGGCRPPQCRWVLVQAVGSQSRGELPKDLCVPPFNREL